MLGAAPFAFAYHLQRRKQNHAHLEQEQRLLQQEQRVLQQEQQAQRLLQAAHDKTEADAREAEVTRQSERLRMREDLEKEFADRNRDLGEQKRRIDKKEEQLDKKEEQLERKSDQLEQREKEQEQRRLKLEEERRQVERERLRIQELTAQVEHRLEEVAGLTMEQAKAQVIATIEEEARKESGRVVKQLEEEAKEQANKRSQELMVTAVQRFAGEFVAENTVSVVPLPSEEMKGRIIGREGRNIRALESATGCDLIIDDTPEAVVISGFHPVRRQIARRALEELVTDGRIHPARIEEVVKKIRKNINNEIREAGEQAVFEAGLHGVHPEIIKLLGTLKFRTSYTQNVLNHSIEVAHFAGIMADELGLDGALARRCGMLHDIGKALDHEIQGSHAVIGGQFAKKFKEDPIVVNAIWSHHFETEPNSVYGPLTNAADALSAARPGARRENIQTYIKRLESLERIANGFKGVEKSYAVQAGRELRVIVGFEKVNDEGSMMLARDIARKVEEEMTYPGQIKVTVIREMRATEIAQ
ncbi:MAG: ribonuclease Y [Magnetococcales bacterium]|nr:ribonuclease Y [Magnetococcales bacterium]